MADDEMELDETAAKTPIIIREKGTGIQKLAPTSPQIIVLDDDEDEPSVKKTKSGENASEKPKENAAENADENIEIIDLIPPKPANNKCINYSCRDGADLTIAPALCLSYYRVRNAGKKKKEICKTCLEQALKEYDLLAEELKSGRVLCGLDVPFRNDTVEIDDSDSEDEMGPESPEFDTDTCDLITDNLERILTETLSKLNFGTQADKEITYLASQTNTLDTNLSDIQNTIKQTRKELDFIQLNLYDQFRSETTDIGTVSIIDDQSFGARTVVRTELPERPKSTRVRKIIPALEPVVPAKTVDDRPADCPLPGNLLLPPLLVEDIYFVSKETLTGSWVKARLKAIYPTGTVIDQRAISAPQYKLVELKQHKERMVDGKNLAMSLPSQIRFETGTRVIAAFKEYSTTGEVRKTRNEVFYPGIVAEPPVAQNQYRYLIFFDIGYSQYVHYHLVNQIVEASKNVWEDNAHVGSRPFIKKYLETSDRPMVKLEKGQSIRAEYNGKWILCTILNVDCSLALVFFDALNRMEWIYRGSSRLSPVYKEEKNAAKRHTGGRTSARTQNPSESATIVQYSKNPDYAKPEPIGGATLATTPPVATATHENSNRSENSRVRAVARKSTARPEPTRSYNRSDHNYVPFLPQLENVVEPTSKIMYFTPRDQIITQRLYRPHTCTPSCKDYVRHNLNKLRGHNPLSKPLLCGWARMTTKVRGRKDIIYKAPCGRILRNMPEIHRYLRQTRSDMTVDLFDFNVAVRCLAEFNVDCEPDPKDLSNGTEQVAVPVVNGINSKTLFFSKYSTKIQPMADVPLNRDPDFLVCCDCEDDCANKAACACCRLTLEGAKYMGRHVDPEHIGYVHRRLYEQVLTGIYECNSRCKCAQTCLNRVVQNPMSVKLQVFMTHSKGWGIRCVNDVPQGTFICIYAGTIHTEQMANQDGVTQGDEYFAELDYIENCEKHKEDYESDVGEDTPPRSNSPDYGTEDEDETAGGPNSGPRGLYTGRRRGVEPDNDFCINLQTVPRENTMRLRRRNDEAKQQENAVKPTELAAHLTASIEKQIETVTISDDEDDPKEVLSFNPKETEDEEKPMRPSVRTFFGEDEPYIMDTKNEGNIGRFLNHSCSPNVFVQNVFVDTHDLRFPWVAFFSSQFIRAGTELTWNYNYDVGSVPGRMLRCLCGSIECKGRLL